jgi:hypothetical protein
VRVQLVRRGGIAGVTVRGEMDTADLPGANHAEQILRALPYGGRPAPVQPDRFQYEITVTENDRSRTAFLGEGELPDGLQPIIDTALARRTPD